MKKTLGLCLNAMLIVSAVVGAANAWSADDAASCNDPRVDRAACMREAGAARQAKQQGNLTSTGGYEENALARCQRQPADARAACEERVRGTGNSEIRGSVPGGGKIRSTETPVPAPAN
ncbi:hypothetical protein [Variovorax sp. GT1P44]|uniref:hypothetical protein n=1 Tax=Variovorax sp. GT1P44 TaxID=3443742 RepID=UPI003F46ABDE